MLPTQLLELISEFADDRTHRVEALLVASAMSDWRRLRKLDDAAARRLSDLSQTAMPVARAIYSLHQEWAENAEQILARTRLSASNTKRVAELEDALCRTKARLMHTPELQDRAFEQARKGETIPAKELRDDLNARLRARREVSMAGT